MSNRDENERRSMTKLTILGRTFYIEDSDEEDEEEESEKGDEDLDDGDIDAEDHSAALHRPMSDELAIRTLKEKVASLYKRLDDLQQKSQEVDARTRFLSSPVKIKRANGGHLVLSGQGIRKPRPLSERAKEEASVAWKARSRLTALFDQFNQDADLFAICADDLVPFEYDHQVFKFIHVGLVFGTLDGEVCFAVTEALRHAKSSDPQIDEAVMDSFWRMTYDGVPKAFGVHTELHYHLVVTALEVLKTSGCDPAYLLHWEYLLEALVRPCLIAADFSYKHKSDIFSYLMEPLCNKRLSSLVSHLSLTETMQVLNGNPYWRLLEKVSLVLGKRPESIPWQLNLALKQSMHQYAPEQVSWIRHSDGLFNIRRAYRTYHDACIFGNLSSLEHAKHTSHGAATITCLALDYWVHPPDLKLCVVGHDVVCVHTWMLVPVWPYIRTVLSVGLAESRERAIELPLEFPPSLLSSILCRVYNSDPKQLPPSEFPWAFVEEYEAMYGFARLFDEIDMALPPRDD